MSASGTCGGTSVRHRGGCSSHRPAGGVGCVHTCAVMAARTNARAPQWLRGGGWRAGGRLGGKAALARSTCLCPRRGDLLAVALCPGLGRQATALTPPGSTQGARCGVAVWGVAGLLYVTSRTHCVAGVCGCHPASPNCICDPFGCHLAPPHRCRAPVAPQRTNTLVETSCVFASRRQIA